MNTHYRLPSVWNLVQRFLDVALIPLLLLSLVLWAGAGCASSGSVTPRVVPTGVDRKGVDTLVIEELAAGQSELKDAKLLVALVAAGVQERGTFRKVVVGTKALPSEPHLRLRMEVQRVRDVSDTGRAFLGAAAGQARVVVDVRVTDATTGAEVQAFEAVGTSSGGWAGAGTTEQAVQRLAEQIAGEVGR